jgi:hypothetical protein
MFINMGRSKAEHATEPNDRLIARTDPVVVETVCFKISWTKGTALEAIHDRFYSSGP